MSIGRALAILGAGAQGYMDGTEKARQQKRQEEEDARRAKDDARRAKDDEWREEQRTRQRQDWSDADAEKQALAAATKPTQATPDLTPDMAGPQSYTVNGQTIADPAKADIAVKEYNSPMATATRQAGALRDPARAAQIRSTAIQGEAATMQLKAAKLKEADEAFNRQLFSSVTDFSSLERFVSESKGDGEGGKLQIKFQPTADGKGVQAMRVQPDGSLKPTEMTFPNSAEGLQQAIGVVGMRTSPEMKLQHLMGMAKTAEEKRRWEAEYKLRKDDSEVRGAREERMARAAEAQLRLAQDQAKATVWDKDADKYLHEMFSSKDPTTGGVVVDGNGLQFGKTLAVISSRGNGGDTMRAIGKAAEVDSKLRKLSTNKDGVYDPDLHAAKRAEYIAQAFKEPGAEPKPGAPAAKAAPAPAAAKPPPAQIPTDPSVVAPAETPAPPSVMERVASGIGGAVDSSRQQGAVVMALQQKVRSGQPLTDAEREQARQFGIRVPG